LATVTYDANSGILLNSNRTIGSATQGINEVYDLTVDNSGNIYVVGAVNNVGTGFDIVVTKLNGQLVQIWEKKFDGYGIEDKGKGVKVDSQGNVYVAGYVTSQNEGK